MIHLSLGFVGGGEFAKACNLKHFGPNLGPLEFWCYMVGDQKWNLHKKFCWSKKFQQSKLIGCEDIGHWNSL